MKNRPRIQRETIEQPQGRIMYSPTTRLLTILELLQARGSISGIELAERLQVEVRSVRRYITTLRDMGIPIDSERGRYGNYALRPGFRMPPLMFTDDETLSVIMGLLLARQLALTDAASIESAMAKIERVLPVELRQRIWALQGAMQFDLEQKRGWDDPTSTGEIIGLMSIAAHQRKRVMLTYQSGKQETTTRELDPYGVVYHAGLWYTVGYCHLRHDLRVFRLDRIQRLALCGSIQDSQPQFERPVGLDALHYVLDSIAQLPGGARVEVLIRAPHDEARRLIPRDLAQLEPAENGVIFRAWSGSLPWMARYLVGLGLPFVVIQPRELRDALRELAMQIWSTANAALT